MYTPPYEYEAINLYQGTRSPRGTDQYDLTTAYFYRSLYQRAMSVFDWTLPEDWSKNYFINVLFRAGFIAIVPTSEYGTIPQICSLSGYGLYLQPTTVLVAQPLVRYEGKIGIDCGLVRLTPDYIGITDIVDHYSRALSEAWTSLHMALWNSRLAWLAAAKDKTSAETLKIILEKISSGEPAIVFDKLLKSSGIDGRDEPIFQQAFDVKNTYIVTDLLADLRTIINDFDREIGIPVVDEKKERRTNPEISSITSDAGCRIDTWDSCLKESVAEVKRVFPDLEISYERRESNVQNTETEPDRTLPI